MSFTDLAHEPETESRTVPRRGSAGSLRSRVRLPFDPLVLVVGLVALVTYLVCGMSGKFARDLGVYAYGARQVLAGQPPYVGIENRAGPLAHLLPVPGIVAARLAGAEDLTGMRASYLLLAVACVVVTYLVGRDLFSSRLAGLVAASTMLSFHGFISLAGSGPREKTPMVLFILCALWALSHRRWLLMGVATSLATLTLQIAFFPLLGAAVVGIVLVGRGRRWRDLARVVVGGAIPVLVLGVYFAAYGALRDFADGFVLINLRYTTATRASAHLHHVWGSLRFGYGASLWLLLGGLALLLVVAVVRALDRSVRRDRGTATLVALAVCAVLSVLWIEIDFDTWEDAFTLLPLAALGVASGVAQLGRIAPRTAVRAVGAGLVVLTTASALQYAATHRDHKLDLQRATTRGVLADVPDARVWSVAAPEYLVLGDKTNPTRYQLLGAGLTRYLADTWPGGFWGWRDWNLAQRPDLIVVHDTLVRSAGWQSHVGPDYVRVARSPSAVWFARRSLGPQVLHAITRDNARIRSRY